MFCKCLRIQQNEHIAPALAAQVPLHVFAADLFCSFRCRDAPGPTWAPCPGDTRPLLVRTHGQALPTHCCGVSTTHSTSIHSVAKQEPPAHAWGIPKLLQHPRITPGSQNCHLCCSLGQQGALCLWQVTHGHSGLPGSPACPHTGTGAHDKLLPSCMSRLWGFVTHDVPTSGTHQLEMAVLFPC